MKLSEEQKEHLVSAVKNYAAAHMGINRYLLSNAGSPPAANTPAEILRLKEEYEYSYSEILRFGLYLNEPEGGE